MAKKNTVDACNTVRSTELVSTSPEMYFSLFQNGGMSEK